MKKIFISIGIIALFLLNGTMAIASNDIILSKDLFKIMNNKDVVIVSAQKESEYQKVHIKNAVFINHKDLYNADGIQSMLKPSSDIAKMLGDKGISNTSTIVVYDQGTGKYAGRLYWILKYMGCNDVKILDGQLKAWMGARKPITKNPTSVSKLMFTANVNKSILATMADVKSDNFLLLDVRSAAEFIGTEGETERKGHIPGAKNMEYKEVLTDAGAFKSKEEIQAVTTKVGLSTDKPVILYCTSSVRAGIVFAAFTDILGYTKVKVYDGAFYEWEASTNKVE